ncbi:CRISPR-associated helicase Cas3' [Brevibacillus fluminis]|uniref:CRISPR-associated helicase Cas3' n=1 Tax=Brevibacillus fluminis TaxID=511487 RepID=UPI003F8B351F
MQNFFSELLKAKPEDNSIEPHPYQLQVAKRLLEGRNLVLTTPTGAGKTWAALLPFLYARKQKLEFADRVIYCLPLRTLASSLYDSTKQALERNDFKSTLNIEVTLQMGNQPNDPLFQGDVIFTTIDQLLSAYIGLPFGTSKAAANIPAGALIGAYVVIDEFHLLSYTEALPTFLDMMKRLQPYTRFLLMTATSPEPVVSVLEKHLDGMSVKLQTEELNKLSTRKRSLYWRDKRMSGQDIASRHQGGRTLVIVNEVKRAQSLYFELASILQQEGRAIEVRVLHSRMFPTHREGVESWIMQAFSQESKEEAILIATQVVEAGLDISATLLLTDLCPANAFLQRAGRCARFAAQEGTVEVYSLREGGVEHFLPYVSRQYQKEESDDYQIMLRTERALKELAPGTIITHELEKQLIETVHGEIDKKRIALVMHDLFLREDQITRALIRGDAEMGELVRAIDNISIIIHHLPEEVDLHRKPEMVSMGRKGLYFFLNGLEWTKEKWENQQLILIPQFPDSQDISARVTWKPIQSPKEVLAHMTVLLSPELAKYHPVVGLQLKKESQNQKQTDERVSKFLDDEKKAATQRFSYQRESYLEHVQDIRRINREEKGKYSQSTNFLSRRFRMTPDQIEEIADLVTALHDVGKLGVEVQRKMRRWQTEYKRKEELELLAHTDFDGTNQEERDAYRLGKYKPPHHAVEGAVALQEWCGKTFDRKIAVPILLAIMRHHNAYSKKSDKIVFCKGAREHVLKSLHGLPYEPVLKPHSIQYRPDELVSWLRNNDVLALYWYLSRRLRLADRASQQLKNRKQNGKEGTDDCLS